MDLPIHEVPGRVEDKVWPLLRLFTNITYAKQWIAESNDLEDEHLERIIHGILQAEEYFRAASHTSLATSPVLFYYGMIHLADVIIAANAEQQPSHHGLKRIKEESDGVLDHLECRVLKSGVFASFNSLVSYDLVPVRNPLGREGVLFDTSVAVSQRYPQRETILGESVHFGDFIGSIPDLSEHCTHSEKITYSTISLYDIQVDSTTEEYTLSLALSRQLKRRVEEYLTSVLGMEELTEGTDLVAFRRVGKPAGKIIMPHLRSPLRGRPHLLADGMSQQISEAATILLLMYILGDLARYQSRKWMRFVSQASEELEIVNEFASVAAVKFPYLILTQLRGQLLHFSV